MGWYQRFCEWGTDATYVPHGQKCDLCGKKLGYLETGFWSVNAKRLADGVICEQCHEKLTLLAENRTRWIPKDLKDEPPFNTVTKNGLSELSLEEAKAVLESVDTFGKAELAAIGGNYSAIFRMKDACFIVPTPLQVGIARAKRLKGRLVLFGFVQLGQFHQGDTVLILDGEHAREATILEAYVFDCKENDLEVMLKAHIGKQRLSQWQKGWLVLDDLEKVGYSITVIG